LSNKAPAAPKAAQAPEPAASAPATTAPDGLAPSASKIEVTSYDEVVEGAAGGSDDNFIAPKEVIETPLAGGTILVELR
jgi:hypothetical protein